MKVSYQKVRDNAILPEKKTEMAAAYDLYAAHIDKKYPDEVIVYLGLAMQPPKGYKIVFVPRSSFTKYKWVLQNSPTQGDADFRDEYRLRFRAIPIGTNVLTNLPQYPSFPYEVGDRIGQMFIEKVIDFEFVEEELPHNTDRKGGFGSTGK